MEKHPLVLKFKDQETEFSYENKVYLVEDKKLIQNLSRPNIKNQDSSLIIKSLNDIHISDVIQIRVNLAETGHFLASFNKETFTDEVRIKLLEEIGKLKNSENPTVELQSKKVQELLGILNNFEPIYVTFANVGEIKLDLDSIVDFKLKFPLLNLKQPERKLVFRIGRPKKEATPKEAEEKTEKPKKEKKARERKEYKPFPLFDSDYLFALFFALLGAFSITASVFEMMNKESIGIFLIILSVVLFLTLIVATTSILYKKGELRNPWLFLYLTAFIAVGIAGGIVASYFICKGLLKTEIEDFDYKKMMLISSLVSSLGLLSSLGFAIPGNLLFQLIKKKKPQ